MSEFGGDYAKAEDELRKMGMDWKSFRKDQEKLILTQGYLQQQLPEEDPITYSELMTYYKANQGSYNTQAQIEIQLIDIQPDELEITEPYSSKENYAKKLANDLFDRISLGEDFGSIARKHSHGHRALYDGLWKPVDPDSLAEPYDILADHAASMNDGDLAYPIQSGGHIFIMKLIRKQIAEIKPFNEVKNQIEAKIRVERKSKVIDELSSQIVKEASIHNLDEFTDFCLAKLYIMSN